MTLTPDEQARYQLLADHVEAADYEPDTANAHPATPEAEAALDQQLEETLLPHRATPEEDAAFEATLARLTGQTPAETPKPDTLDNHTDHKE